MSNKPTIYPLPIIHYSANAAVSVVEALSRLKPDIIFVEGAPDLNALTPYFNHPRTEFPMATVIFDANEPTRSVRYRWDYTAPEAAAVLWGLENDIPVRWADMPGAEACATIMRRGFAPMKPDTPPDIANRMLNPLGYIARSGGYEQDSIEGWWDFFVEPVEFFALITDAIAALRSDTQAFESEINQVREAYMRREIRLAHQEFSFATGVFVCGGYHSPSVSPQSRLWQSEGHDEALLTTFESELNRQVSDGELVAPDISVTVVGTTAQDIASNGYAYPKWNRMLFHIASYARQSNLSVDAQRDFIFQQIIEKSVQASRALIDAKYESSPAHVIAIIQMAETLRLMRGESMITVTTLLDSIASTVAQGDKRGALRAIFDDLFIGDMMGSVPDDAPLSPLTRDFHAQIDRLKRREHPTKRDQFFGIHSNKRDASLNMTHPQDRLRNELANRVLILGCRWAMPKTSDLPFHNAYTLQWTDQCAIDLADAYQWGTTIELAAENRVMDEIKSADVERTGKIISYVLQANLPQATYALLHHIDTLSANGADLQHVSRLLPYLCSVLLHDIMDEQLKQFITNVVKRVIARVQSNLAMIVCNIKYDPQAGDKNPAELARETVEVVNGAVIVMADASLSDSWYDYLEVAVGWGAINAFVAGSIMRLIRHHVTEIFIAAYMNRLASDHNRMSEFILGFFEGAGSQITIDALFNVFFGWVKSMPESSFRAALPTLVKVTETWEKSHRDQFAQKAKHRLTGGSTTGGFTLPAKSIQQRLGGK